MMRDRKSLLPYYPLTGPAMKGCLLFAAGILIAQHTNPQPVAVLLILGITVVLCAVLNALRLNALLGSLAASAVMVCAGMASLSIAAGIHRPVEIPMELVNSRVAATGRVTGPCRYSNGNTTWILDCTEIAIGGSSSDLHGKIAVSGELTCTFFDRQVPLDEGSILTVEGRLRRIRRLLTRRDFLFSRDVACNVSTVPRMSDARLIVDSIVTADGSAGSSGSFFDEGRKTMSRLIDRYPYGGHRAILKAMTIGERNDIPLETGKQYALTGIAHILAVSGLHVGILVMVLTFLLRLFPLSKKLQFAATVLFMFLYAGICGFLPPVTRTVIMFTLLMGASLIERPRNAENSLFTALIIVLAFDPRALFGASLQLSFAAVWTITTFYRPLYDLLCKPVRHSTPVRYVLSLAITSLLATAGTAPIVAAHFGSLPVYGLLANLAAIPLAAGIVTLGSLAITATALGAVAAPLGYVAQLLSVITGLLLSVLNWTAAFVASLPYSSIAIQDTSLFWGCCLALWLYLLSRSQGRPLFQKLLLYIPLVFLLITAWSPVIGSVRAENRQALAVFFDVGQGDAALVAIGDSHCILIDTGPRYDATSAAESMIIPSLKNAGIPRLDGIFISHPHTDHMGGLESILKNARSGAVTHIFCSQSLRDSLAALYGEKSTVIGLSAGDSVAIGQNGMLVLAPAPTNTKGRGLINQNLYYATDSDANNSSLVFRFDVSGKRILFTGDIESQIQQHAASWGAALRADILKVPHHGARGISPSFVREVHPSVAVISCGANNIYGHPAESTIATLLKDGSTVMRTDRDGSILIRLPDLAISSR